MLVMERDVILQGVDENGTPSIDFPLARLGWMDSSAEVKEMPGGRDYVPVVDGDEQEQMKKSPVNALVAGSGFFAPEYSEARAYAVGDYCTRGGSFCKCVTAIPEGGEAWDAAHWQTVTVGAELRGVQAAIQGLIHSLMTNELTLPLTTDSGEALLTDGGTPILATYHPVR